MLIQWGMPSMMIISMRRPPFHRGFLDDTEFINLVEKGQTNRSGGILLLIEEPYKEKKTSQKGLLNIEQGTFRSTIRTTCRDKSPSEKRSEQRTTDMIPKQGKEHLGNCKKRKLRINIKISRDKLKILTGWKPDQEFIGFSRYHVPIQDILSPFRVLYIEGMPQIDWNRK